MYGFALLIKKNKKKNKEKSAVTNIYIYVYMCKKQKSSHHVPVCLVLQVDLTDQDHPGGRRKRKKGGRGEVKSWQRQDGQSNGLPADLLSREADMTGFPFESLWRDIKDNEISRLLNFKRRQPNNRQAGRQTCL